MSLQFGMADYESPKIDIIGKEVPLAAMEKTGAVLQDRYDKSYENFTKFNEMVKQTEQIADPLERDKVRSYLESLQPQLKDITERGDYHNMRWQTMALANNAANNLKVFGERAGQIAKIKEEIAKADKIADPVKKQYYENMLNEQISKTSFDGERGVFNFQALTSPKMVNDYDYTKLFLTEGSGWNANSAGFENKDVFVVNKPVYNPDGSLKYAPGVYNKGTNKLVEEVKFKEVYDNMLKMLKGSPGAMEAINEDVNIYMWKNNIPEENRQQVFDKIYKEKVLNVAEGVAEKEAYKKNVSGSEISFASENANVAFGFGKEAQPDEGIIDDYESTLNPGEKSPVIENLTANPSIKQAGKNGTFTFKNPATSNLAKIVFSGLSPSNLEKMKNGTEKEKELYAKLNAANIYETYNQIIDGEPINNNRYNNIMTILNSANYIPSTAYKFMSYRDQRFADELARSYDVRDAQRKLDPVKAQKAMDHTVFGNADGLKIDKNGKYNMGVAEGLTIFDPQTGEAKSLKDFLLENASNLKEQTIQTSGKILAGSLPQANSDNPQQDLSFMNSGYTANINGKQYIIGNKKLNNSPSAKLGDLASFSRYSRSPKTYTYRDLNYEVASDASGNVIVKTQNGVKKYPKELYNQRMEQLGNAGVDPTPYLGELDNDSIFSN
jgi:hypothetical protein